MLDIPYTSKLFIQCFDTVGWVAGKATGLEKTEWWGAGMVICLERGADLHMAQLMPLPLIVSCFSKIQIGFTFLVLAHLGSPGKRPLNRCVCAFKMGQEMPPKLPLTWGDSGSHLTQGSLGTP